MGEFYRVSCPKCDPSPYGGRNLALGCGLGYPEACQAIYKDIRKGKYGSEVKRSMFWMRRPAIYHQLALYVCKSCGRWQQQDDIRLCRLKKGLRENPGSSIDRERQRRVKVNMKALCYLDPREYDVVWETKYPCPHCGGETAVEKQLSSLRCNTCGSAMNVRMEGCWD